MSTEYGIFSDEGLLEGEFYTRESADAAMSRYAEDDAHVGEVCPDHPGHECMFCSPCIFDHRRRVRRWFDDAQRMCTGDYGYAEELDAADIARMCEEDR